jgi:hypothetical protein
MCLLTTNERMSVGRYNSLSRSAATLYADVNRHILINDIYQHVKAMKEVDAGVNALGNFCTTALTACAKS